MSFKLACRIPQLNDITSFYRAAGPLSEIRRQWTDFSTHHLGLWNWATLSECDCLFMQRAYSEDDVEIMQMAKDVGVPVVLDYDDLLINVPSDNPSYFQYMTPEHIARVKVMLENCAACIVSTEALKKALERFAPKCPRFEVIPNAFNFRFFRSYAFEDRPKRTKRISWRGSRTHHRDVFAHAMVLAELQDRYKEWEFHFVGDSLWLATDNMHQTRTVISPAVEWPRYFKHLWNMAPSCMIAPLHNHPFNHCKSNIAWIEGAFTGAVTIAPQWPEWTKPGCLNYANDGAFREVLEMVMRGSVEIEVQAARAWEFIADTLDLRKVNSARMELFKTVAEEG